MTTKGIRPSHIPTLLGASSERGQEGKEISACWAPSMCQAGCQTHRMEGGWAPHLFLTGSFGLYLSFYKNCFILLSCVFV